MFGAISVPSSPRPPDGLVFSPKAFRQAQRQIVNHFGPTWRFNPLLQLQASARAASRNRLKPLAGVLLGQERIVGAGQRLCTEAFHQARLTETPAQTRVVRLVPLCALRWHNARRSPDFATLMESAQARPATTTFTQRAMRSAGWMIRRPLRRVSPDPQPATVDDPAFAHTGIRRPEVYGL